MPVPNLFSTPSLDAPSASPSETEIEIVRPDRNLEKWPNWEPSNSRHSPQARTIQREIRLPDGSKAVATVEVGFTNKGSLTTEDQKTFYALIKYWENVTIQAHSPQPLSQSWERGAREPLYEISLNSYLQRKV